MSDVMQRNIMRPEPWDGSTQQGDGLDLGAQGQAGADRQPFGRAPRDARQQRVAGDIEAYQHVPRGVGRRQVDDGGGDAIEDAGLLRRNQRQTDVAGMDAAAQQGARG